MDFFLKNKTKLICVFNETWYHSVQLKSHFKGAYALVSVLKAVSAIKGLIEENADTWHKIELNI